MKQVFFFFFLKVIDIPERFTGSLSLMTVTKLGSLVFSCKNEAVRPTSAHKDPGSRGIFVPLPKAAVRGHDNSCFSISD